MQGVGSRSYSTNPLKRAGLVWAVVVVFFGWHFVSNWDEFTGDPKGIAFLAGLVWYLVIPPFRNRQRVEIDQYGVRVKTGSKTQTMHTADLEAVAFFQQKRRRRNQMRHNRRDRLVLVGRGMNLSDIDRRNRYYTSSEAVKIVQTMSKFVQVAADGGEQGVHSLANEFVEDDITEQLFAMCDEDPSVGVITVGLRGMPNELGELLARHGQK